MGPDPADVQIDGHAARNKMLCERLEELGVDLRKPRLTDHFFLCPSRAAALRIAEEVASQGFRVRQVDQSDDEGQELRWDLWLLCDGAHVELVALDFVASMVAAAVRHSAEYDGWGTTADRKAPGPATTPQQNKAPCVDQISPTEDPSC